MNQKSKWYTRIEIPKITLDWLKTHYKPTSRELELLELIEKRKLVRRDHLEIISPSYRPVSSRTRLLNRAIKKMFLCSVIDKYHEKQELGKGNTPCIVACDRGGSVLLKIPHKPRIKHHKKVIKGQEFTFRSLPP